MGLQSYRDLVAWQKAIDLAEAIYLGTQGFPNNEIYNLTSQIRKACVSVPSNIAEGQGRRTTNDFLHFIGIAYGSLCEVETQITLAIRFRYLTDAQAAPLFALSAEVGRLINGLSRSLESTPPR